MENNVTTYHDCGWNDRVNILCWKLKYNQYIDPSVNNVYEIVAAKILVKIYETEDIFM